MENRIQFIDDLQIMEVDFSDLDLSTSQLINEAYDALETAISETNDDLWFFMVNYSGTRIDPDAWFTFSRRGKALNLAHSQGSVRFDVGEDTKREIERRANTEEFDANLLSSRDDAIKRISTFKSKRLAKVVHAVHLTLDDMKTRVSFDAVTQIMDINFSDLTIAHSIDVNLVYDFLEDRIAETGTPKWFFLINYENTHIYPEAWIPYSQRGKSLNINHSLGSVRYAPGSETEETIRMRAESQDFRPNIRNNRDEALDRIAEMKTEIVHS